MARHKLTDRRVKLATKAGFVSDGHRLNLNVRKDGTMHWVYRYTSPVTGAVRDHGLGSLDVVPLARAREKAQECDRLVDDGKDPAGAVQGFRFEKGSDGSGLDVTFDPGTAPRATDVPPP